MRNFIFSLMAMVFLGTGVYGQTKNFNIDDFLTTGDTVTLPKNERGLSNCKTYELKNGYVINECYDIKNQMNNIVVYVEDNKNSFTFYYKKIEDIIYVYNNELFLIYSVDINSKKIVVNSANNLRSCFGQCVDNLEDEFTDDFWGYVAYNTNPAVPLAIAISCAIECS